MPTIVDVARRAGVSPVTVSRVLNGTARVNPATRDAVERVIAELGYVPNIVARSLRSRRTGTLGLILPDISNPLWAAVARGVEDAARSHDYVMFLGNSNEDPATQEHYLQSMISQRVEGIIVVPCEGEMPNPIPPREQGIPVVAVHRPIQGWDTDMVTTDIAAGARALVRHLVALGYSRVAVLTGPTTTFSADECVAGYCLALNEAGIPIDLQLVRRGELRVVSAARMTNQLFEEGLRPDAILAANNILARGALDALQQRGLRVPEDIALVSFDDSEALSAFFPFMTVIALPGYELGSNAAQLLLSRLYGAQSLPSRRVVLPTRLIIRHSCGCYLKHYGEQFRFSIPASHSTIVQSVLVKPLSDTERDAGFAYLGLRDMGTLRHTLRPSDQDSPNVTRLLRVLQHQEADRVPHLNLWVTSRAVYEYVLGRPLRDPTPNRLPDMPPGTPEEQVEFAVRLGMDAVACNFSWQPNNLFAHSSDGSICYVGGSVRNWADLDKLEPPPVLADQLDILEHYLRAAQGTRVGIVASFSSFFDCAMRAVGMIEALYLFYDDRPFLEALMDILLEHQERVMRAVCDRFAEDLAFVLVKDEIAHNVGLMIRPDMFEEMFVPRMQRLIAPAKEHGKLVGLYTRGRMEKVLPILERIGFDIVLPMEPECNDLAYLKQQWRGRIAFIGGIPLSLLTYGSWESIEQTVQEACVKLAPGGGYVLGASGPITEGVPPQNVWVMAQAVHKYGQYAHSGEDA
ncbi:MAG: substrate-binding domain-containing protein [Anaerolineae bacterium]